MATAPPKEFTINKPTPFDGDRKEVTSFIQNCQAYLQVNAHIYTTDDSRVAFILSFMNEKEAKRWKQNFYLTITDATTGLLVFPAFAAFLTTVKNDFKPANQTRDAEHQIAILRQGKKTAEETITEFRLLSNQAGYANTTSSDHLHLIGKLRSTLNTRLVKQIMLSDTVPTTIDEWAEKAIKIDNNYRQTMEVIERLNDERKAGPSKPSKWSTNSNNNNSNSNNNNNSWRKKKEEKDPDAMDVDAMSTQKRAYLMKKGACFICEETGHRARDHNDYVKDQDDKKGKKPERKEVRATQKGKQATLKEIHALLNGLSKEDKEALVTMQKGGPSKDEEEEETSENEGF